MTTTQASVNNVLIERFSKALGECCGQRIIVQISVIQRLDDHGALEF